MFSTIGVETMIGNVDIKTRSVYFFVQRNGILVQDGIIPYEIERLNVGGAMNVTTGAFIAPVPGIYHFQFSSAKVFSSNYAEAVLQLNGNRISYSVAGKWGSKFNAEISNMREISCFLRLKTGDRVEVSKSGAALNDASGHHSTYFTGSLLEEELELA